MNNEVTKTETNLPAEAGSWGMEGTVDSSDILIPKVLLMQGISKFVMDEKCQAGDLVDSVTAEVLGSAREKALQSVRVVPLMAFKTWSHYEKNEDDQWEYRGSEPWGPANANLPREEYQKDGTTWRSDRTLNYYVLVLDKETGEPKELPYLLSFKRTSYRAGQKLVNYFTNVQIAARKGNKVTPADFYFNLCGAKKENDLGTFYVADLEQGEQVPEHVKTVAWDWYQTLRKGTHKIDESDEAAEPTVSAESTDF